MPDATALRAALKLLHVPSQLQGARGAPLPAGVTDLLLAAVGDRAAVHLDRRIDKPDPRGHRVGRGLGR